MLWRSLSLRPARSLPPQEALDAALWPVGSPLPPAACSPALRRLPGWDSHPQDRCSTSMCSRPLARSRARRLQDAPCPAHFGGGGAPATRSGAGRGAPKRSEAPGGSGRLLAVRRAGVTRQPRAVASPATWEARSGPTPATRAIYMFQGNIFSARAPGAARGCDESGHSCHGEGSSPRSRSQAERRSATSHGRSSGWACCPPGTETYRAPGTFDSRNEASNKG